ncbi:hypothetical protein FJZ31_07060 [Candidatus Poribacteria bacterium]|nr:hypothetical protein [Candidatus Poribacteria bacterium]
MTYKIVQELKPNETPRNMPKNCLKCSKELFRASDFISYCGHEMSFEYRYCPECGWFDLKYEEWGMMDYPEEFLYIQGEVFPCTISDLEEAFKSRFYSYSNFPREFSNSEGEIVTLSQNPSQENRLAANAKLL